IRLATLATEMKVMLELAASHASKFPTSKLSIMNTQIVWGAVCKVSHAENNINILPHLASNNV
ncbi:hypothetical protein P3574_24375, partial [Vibrio parahaemolyticus]|nr:hypothetical protein [Vibrio parahaemolyticus]